MGPCPWLSFREEASDSAGLGELSNIVRYGVASYGGVTIELRENSWPPISCLRVRRCEILKNSNSIKRGRGLTRRLIRWRSWRFTEKSRRSKGRRRKALSF